MHLTYRPSLTGWPFLCESFKENRIKTNITQEKRYLSKALVNKHTH